MKHRYITKRKHPDDGPSYAERLKDYMAKGKLKSDTVMEEPLREANRLGTSTYSKKYIY
jgi:hypothetical protein